MKPEGKKPPPRDYCNVVQFSRRDGPFWNALTPGMTDYVKEINRQLGPWHTKVPLREANRRRASMLGHATDYLAGLLLAGSIYKTIVSHVSRAIVFARDLALDWKTASRFYLANTEGLCGRLDLLRPVDSWKHSWLLGMALISLAQVEAVSRSALTDYLPPLGSLPRSAAQKNARKWFSSHVDEPLVEEWIELAEALRQLILPLGNCRQVIYNPVTGAYGRLAGSDADLYIDGTLYDIKTTIDGRLRSVNVRQLLAYVALNRLRSTTPPIDSVGLIFPRQGRTWNVDLPGLCRATGVANLTKLTAAVKTRLEQKRLTATVAAIATGTVWRRPGVDSTRLESLPAQEILSLLMKFRLTDADRHIIEPLMEKLALVPS